VSTNDLSKGMWNYCYKAISTCNIFLFILTVFTSVGEETRQVYAEVKFIGHLNIFG
jgi:hypothetical protein